MTRAAGAAAALDGTAGTLLNEKGSSVFSIGAGASVYEAVAKMDECRVGALFVVENGAPVGVISERDYARKIILQGRSSRQTAVREIMSSPVISVERSTPLAQCLRIVTERRVRHLAVFAKLLIFKSVFASGYLVPAIIALVGSFIGVTYYLATPLLTAGFQRWPVLRVRVVPSQEERMGNLLSLGAPRTLRAV